MKTGRALLAGMAGAAVMSIAMFLARLAGIPVSLEAMLGSILFPDNSSAAWLAGLVMHLAVGACVALLYATAFEFATQRSGWIMGAAFGVAHGLMAGLFMSAIPAMNPLIPGIVAAPGPFLSNISYGPALFLLLHALFGATVGLVYGHAQHRPHLIEQH